MGFGYRCWSFNIQFLECDLVFVNSSLGRGLFVTQKQLLANLLFLHLYTFINVLKRVLLKMKVKKLIWRVLVDNREQATKRAQIRACFSIKHRSQALRIPLISEVNIHKITKYNGIFFNKQNSFKMKKQSVKGWIKGFFPNRQKISNKTPSQIQVAFRKQQNWTQAQAQIVDHLINMNTIIKISKQISEYQYAFLNGINQILCQEQIDINQTRKSLLGGLQVFSEKDSSKYITKQLPYQYYSVRSLLWKINIGYLPTNNKGKWVSYMQKNLITYRKYIHQYIVQPIQKKLGLSNLNNPIQFKKPSQIIQQKHEQKIKDHPLNFSQQSRYGSYFKDVQLWNTIQKDTKRTRKNCKFFQQLNPIQLENQEIMLTSDQITFSQRHQLTYTDSLTRIIFIYLKNHPNSSYCQGMNELAAIIYYCFTNKNSQYFRRVSQSDTYFVFEKIITLLPKKHFNKGQQYIKDFINVMKKLDLRLFQQMQKNKNTQMIKLLAMKWFLSGFLTQFSIDQSLIIWDVFIGWPGQNYLLNQCFTYMALSLVHLNRQKIVDGQNIAQIFNQINNSPTQLVQKTQSLYKLFPKLLQK